MNYRPDRWCVLEIYDKELDWASPVPVDKIYKVFATWSGGYLSGDSWRLNSGITEVDEDDNYIYFYGESGSCYQCRKGMEGVAGASNHGELNNLLSIKGVKRISYADYRPA